MKILYLITKSNWGGAQRYVYDLAATFSSRGNEICVASGGNGDLFGRLHSENIETYTLPSLVRDVRFIAELKAARDVYRLIKNKRPDVIHLNSSKAAGIGALCGRLLGVKNIVVTIHGAPFREERKMSQKRLIYFFTWITCLLAHHVITVSRQDERDIAAMWFLKKKVTTIYLGLVYSDLPSRTTPKSRTTHIVTIAELHRNKGLMYALEAINALHKQGISVLYSIFGEGDDRKKLEQYIFENQLGDIVELRGHVLNASDNLQEFDLFLLPSVKEGLPYVLLEAGKAMLPVVTTTVGGIPEIIRHEETGLLVQSKDVDALAKELKRLIVDRNFAKKLGAALHDHVVQNFSHTKMLVKTAKIYGLIKS